MKRVYIINGHAGSGKDTFILVCRQFLSGIYDVLTYSAVDEVKRFLIEEEGWDGVTKDAYWRNRMYEVKMEMVKDGDRPTRYLLSSIEGAPSSSLIFLHIREPEEITKLLQLFPDARTLHIHRENVGSFDNPADANTRNFEYTYYLDNSGSIEDLTQTVREFLKAELSEIAMDSEQLDFGDFK